jgi:hypothetical protein
MQWLIPVAVKPFVKKYIGQDYPVDPFVLSTTNKYGMFLYHCISQPEKKPLHLVNTQTIDETIYTDIMNVKLTDKRKREIGCIMTPESVVHFNKFVQQDFNEEFYKYVKHRIGPKGTIYRAIMNFRAIYEISEDEYPYRTMERAFQRRNEVANSSLSA